ncbi:hypothetical protein [Kocuria sabuli]|uniref:hypothetical protein n=1 Tax=Kocuria sabuli TaxID=3071448 RepID=UPI0034D3B866
MDGIGNPVQTVVAGSFGHDGSSTGVAYGAAAGTGADTTLFDIRWGNHHILSFSGGSELDSYDQVDLPAETQQFADSPRFRQDILPILRSLTAGEPPAVDSEATGPTGTILDTDADIVAEDVASAVSGSPDAPHTVTVSNGADKPTLATVTVND